VRKPKAVSHLAGIRNAMKPSIIIPPVASWFFRDAVWRNRSIVFSSVLLGGFGLALEVIAYGAIYLFLSSVEEGRMTLPSATDVTMEISDYSVFGVAVISFLLLMLSGLFTFMSRKKTLTVARSHEEFCTKRVSVLASRLPHPACPVANSMLSPNSLKDLERKGSRACGRALRLVMNAIRPLLILIVSLFVLSYIDFLFSGIVLVLLGITLFFLHRIYRTTINSARTVESLSVPAALERNKRLMQMLQIAQTIDYDHPPLTKSVSRGVSRKFMDASFGRQWAREKTKLAVNLLNSVALLVVIFVAGVGIVYAEWKWSALLAFLVAFRYFTTNLRLIAGVVASLSSYYPPIRRYCDFVEDARAADEGSEGVEAVNGITLDIPGCTSSQPLDLERGDLAFLFHIGNVDRHLVTKLQCRTKATSSVSAPLYWFVSKRFEPRSDIQALQSLIKEHETNDLQNDLALLLPRDALESFDNWLLQVSTRKNHVRTLSPEYGTTLLFLKALYSRIPIIVVASKVLNQFDGGWQQRIIPRFGKRIFIVVVDALPADFPVEGRDVVILSDHEKLIKWGSFSEVIELMGVVEPAPVSSGLGEEYLLDDEDD
jgi:ABC-type multidrug transport system fused ATPase/permease subunit